MRVSVVVDDKTVVVDDVAVVGLTSTWPTTSDDIWAYQWYDGSGEIEYRTPINHGTFTDISVIQPYIDAHSAALEVINANQVAITSSIIT